MKKLLSIGLLTVCALALTERQADAWINSKFSIGMNWHIQSANNQTLWGFWKNGQVPGPEAFGQPGGAPHGIMPPAAQQQNFPFFGNAPTQYPYSAPQGFPTGVQQMSPQNFPVDAYSLQNIMQQQAYMANAYNPYRAVSYQPAGYYSNYSYPAYYHPYQYQVPYYWYQGR